METSASGLVWAWTMAILFKALPFRLLAEDKYNTSTGKVDQTVSVNGNVVSTLSTSSGQGGLGWGTAMECQQANCGTVPTHHWLNTKLTMSAPNPNYKNTLRLNGASGNLVTADGGTTWTVDDITINQYTFT
ncbi:MAG: hypothetical protein Q9227_004465 [Pyrenula ochraceoflavens]